MATTFFNIVPAKYAEAAQTVQYTVSGDPQAASVNVIIDSFSVTNVGSGEREFSCNLVPKNGSVDNSNLILDARVIAEGETYNCPELVGQTLNDGDFISTLASVASSLVIRVSGRLITT